MVETDVELILGEIRDRVRATHEASAIASNGVDSSAVARNATRAVSTAETLALISSYLTTTARAWDQFPPLVSNRNGVAARVELWLKRFFRRGTRWYVWEQVNFNAAVHHALRDLLPVLAAYEHELENLRAETAAARGALQIEVERQDSELTELRAELRAEFAAQLAAQLAAQRAETQAALRRQSDLSSSQNAQVATQLTALLEELRAREEHLREEQRVCFKQLTLEMSEAATLEDRSRRKTETLLAELQRRLDEVDKKMSNE
ncbi:MAG TPA: hypothetical protein DC047_10125 [Blastocatellia bacterium]|nr:hypothetical protein [Blastocatellia bacterium]